MHAAEQTQATFRGSGIVVHLLLGLHGGSVGEESPLTETRASGRGRESGEGWRWGSGRWLLGMILALGGGERQDCFRNCFLRMRRFSVAAACTAPVLSACFCFLLDRDVSEGVERQGLLRTRLDGEPVHTCIRTPYINLVQQIHVVVGILTQATNQLATGTKTTSAPDFLLPQLTNTPRPSKLHP